MHGWGTLARERRRLLVGTGAGIAIVAVAAWLLVSGGSRPAEATSSPTPVAQAPSLGSRATPSPSPTPTPRATPSPAPTPEAWPGERYTVLVLGSDSDSRRRARGHGYLTDAITVVSVAVDGSDVAMISLPRDASDIPMPDGSTWTRKVNAIAPSLGPAAMRDAMSAFLGIPVDRYVMIDMDDFRRVVDAVGGVTVHVPYALTDNRCSIGAGSQHLDGGLALCYARHRAVDSDYARASRHQQLLVAIRDRILAGAADLPALVAVLDSLQTDVAASEVSMLLELAVGARSAEVTRVVLGPEYMTFAGIAGARGWISVPDVGLVRETVASLIGGPERSVGAAPADDRGQRPPGDLQVE